MFNHTLFRLSQKNMLYHPVLNLLTLIQMIAVFFISVSLTSGICSRFDNLRPFRSMLSQDGEFLNTIFAINPDTGVTLNKKDLSSALHGDTSICGVYNVWVTYQGGDDFGDQFLSYDDELLHCFRPELAEGEWFSENLTNADVIPVVVSQNQYNLHAGDDIVLHAVGYENGIPAKIIGVLKEGAKYIGCTAPKNETFSAKNLYSNYYYEIEEKALFLMPQSLIGDGDKAITQLHGPMFVTYHQATASDKLYNHDFLMRIGNSYNNQYSIILRDSYQYIFEECRLLLPILIAVFTMTVIGSMSVNALMAKRRLHCYAVFYICGLKWKECAKISLYSSAIIGLLSVLLTIGGIGIMQNTLFMQESVTRLGAVQILVMFSILFLYMMFAVVLPIRLIHSRTPIQVLHEE